MIGPSWLERLWQEWGSARPVPLSRTVEITRQIRATHDVFDVDADAHRFYGDGTESGSTALAAEDADHTITVDTDQQVHVRWRVQEIGAGSLAGATTDDYGVEFSIDGGAWTTPTGATSGVQMDTASGLTDGGATTQRLANGSGTFFAGEQAETDAEITDFQHEADNYCEHVFALKLIAADLSDGQTIDFRLTLNAGNPGMDNTATPTLTIDKTPPPPEPDPFWPTFPQRASRIIRPSPGNMRSALICEYLHQEHSGAELLDSSGNGFRAAMVGSGYNWLQTRFGIGLQTTARATKAEIDRVIPFTSSVAWEIVFVADETPQTATSPELMGTENNNKVELGNSTNGVGSIRCEIMTGGNGAASPINVILSGGLYHLICTRERESGDNVIYLDGVEVGRSNTTQNTDYTTNKFAWGSEGASPSNGFLGTFFLLRIYDSFVDPSEASWLADDPWRINRPLQIAVLAPPGGDTPINAEAGSYAITGAAATTLYGRVLSGGAVAGAYAITGAPATTAKGFAMNAEPGAYAVTGAPATTLVGTVLSGGAVAGAYTVAGQPATTLVGTVLSGGGLAGSYALTGQAAATEKGFALNAEPGSYAITGAPATTLHGHALNAEAGAYALTGAVAATLKGTLLSGAAQPGAYAISGAPTTTLLGVSTEATAGAYGITGAPATTLHGQLVKADPGAYAISGVAADTAKDIPLNAEPGAYAVTGAATTESRNVPINAEPGAYAISGAAATTSTTGDTPIDAEPGAYAVTGAAAVTLKGYLLKADPGTYAITGAAATTVRDVPINAEPGAYTITGVAATTLVGRVLQADAGAYAINGAAATTETAGDTPIDAEPGAYAITGAPATLLVGRLLDAQAGAYVTTGAAATTAPAYSVAATAGAYTITGADLDSAQGLAVQGVRFPFEPTVTVEQTRADTVTVEQTRADGVTVERTRGDTV